MLIFVVKYKYLIYKKKEIMTKEIEAILSEINAWTQKIKKDCPEIYNRLDENPNTFGVPKSGEKELEEFQNYLNSLKAMYKKALAEK